MYYQRLLYEYEKKMHRQKRRWNELIRKEKYGLIAVIAFSVLLLVSITFLGFRASFWWKLLTMVSYIGMISSVVYCEIYYRRYDDQKMERYNGRLEAVKEILLNKQYRYYTVECIDKIIEWCDKYSGDDDIWICLLRPFGAFFTVVFIPVAIAVLEFWVNHTSNWKEVVLIAVAFILIAFLAFLLWYVFGAEVRDKLNKRRILAKKLAEDLRNLKLKEPKIPKSFDDQIM